MIDFNLKYKDGLTFIKEYETDGHSPLLYLADDYTPYVTKCIQTNSIDYYIINEFFCHYLLKCWSLQTPDIAAIKINKNNLPDNISARHKPHYYDTICFGSQLHDNVIELQSFITSSKKVSQKRISNAHDIFLIALFDIWVQNEDRKPTNNNLILVPNKNKLILTAIDHAYSFSSLDYPSLKTNSLSFSYNDSILHSDFGTSFVKLCNINKAWFDDSSKLYYLCIEKSKAEFYSIANAVPQELKFSADLQKCLYDFLFNEERIKQAFFLFVEVVKEIKDLK